MGCEPPMKVASSPPPAPESPPSPEKIKVVVLRLENMTKKGKADTSTGEDRLFGNGVRAQLVSALEQTGHFTIVNNTGPQEVLQRRALTPTGEISERMKDRLGSLGYAELLVAGALTTYQLSKETKNAGIGADLLFREPQAREIALDGIVETAKKVFGNLKSTGPDRVALELWLFDAKTGKRLASTTIEGTPNDSGDTIGGLFGPKLATVTIETATPMQRALRGVAIRATNWVADTHAAFRAGTLVFPPVAEKRKTSEFESEPKRGVNTLPPTAVRPARAERKTSVSVRTPEKSTPPPPPPATPGDDWGSPSGHSTGRIEKVPAQNSEEWGEK